MNHFYYVPLFSKIVDSSIWEEPDYVLKIFITMLVKKDKDDIVRGTAYNISRWARKTELEVLEALKILSSPDARRLEPQPYEGRRIERVEDGWLILNADHYQRKMKEANRKEYNRVKQAEHRAKEKQALPPFSKDPASHTDGATDAEALRSILPGVRNAPEDPVEHSSPIPPPADLYQSPSTT